MEHASIPYADARTVVWQRQNGRCALCLDPMTDAHHRQRRGLGCDCPGNLLGLCSPCHHDRVHARPARAREHGWIVSAYAANPCEVPVFYDGEWWLLGCDGTVSVWSPDRVPSLF